MSSAGDPRALGQLLRVRRERLTPQDVGLPPGTRRRTSGLRREEVAVRAGVSADESRRRLRLGLQLLSTAIDPADSERPGSFLHRQSLEPRGQAPGGTP